MQRRKNHNSRIKKYESLSVKKNKQQISRKKLISRINIKIVKHPVKEAIEHYNSINKNKASFNTIYEVLYRITLNYIRHLLTNYDHIANELGLHGNNDMIGFKENVNKKILKKYDSDFVLKEITKHINGRESIDATFNT